VLERRAMSSVLRLALVAVWLVATACGRDYFYVGRMEVEGDALVVTFLETCPGASLQWDGTFHDVDKADLSVDAHDNGCSDTFETRYDLRPIKWTFIGQNPEATGSVFLRVAGFDADRGPDCVGYAFAPSRPNQPGSGFAISCE
jgi:hypothetical protein